MEIRRAFLLFAIVLGLAALVTSFTRSGDGQTEDRAADSSGSGGEPSGDTPRPPPRDAGSSTASTRPAAGPAALRFPAGADAVTRKLRRGRAATLTVEVLAPGQVTIDNLGLSSAAGPGTPARFDVLLTEPGRYAITFTPANGADGRTIGRLRVRE